MQSSLRARRESAGSGPEADVVPGRGSANRPWFAGLFGLFGSKPSGPRVADPNVNALLAFPSETAPRPEPIPIADVAPTPAPGLSQPAA